MNQRLTSVKFSILIIIMKLKVHWVHCKEYQDHQWCYLLNKATILHAAPPSTTTNTHGGDMTSLVDNEISSSRDATTRLIVPASHRIDESCLPVTTIVIVKDRFINFPSFSRVVSRYNRSSNITSRCSFEICDILCMFVLSTRVTIKLYLIRKQRANSQQVWSIKTWRTVAISHPSLWTFSSQLFELVELDSMRFLICRYLKISLKISLSVLVFNSNSTSFL
jgi:hypothetical protein